MSSDSSLCTVSRPDSRNARSHGRVMWPGSRNVWPDGRVMWPTRNVRHNGRVERPGSRVVRPGSSGSVWSRNGHVNGISHMSQQRMARVSAAVRKEWFSHASRIVSSHFGDFA